MSTTRGFSLDDIDEMMIRAWFMKTDLEQAIDTFRVVEGIIETRKEFQPKRKKRSDAGQSRDKDPGSQGLLDR